MADSNPDPCGQTDSHPPSPISHLSPELLTKIFEYLITCSSPIVLLRVCRRWANIASSVSSLWTRIDFSTPPASLILTTLGRPTHRSQPVILTRRTNVTETMGCQRATLPPKRSHFEMVLDLPVDHLQQMWTRTFSGISRPGRGLYQHLAQ